jgi:ADP-ribosylglycohydrolase
MLGAIAGDIIGSPYEDPSGRKSIKTTDFPLFARGCRFSDDSVLTVAVADSILTGADYTAKLREYYRRYPKAGFSSTFAAWGRSDQTEPATSRGNGAAMRVSPVGFAFDTLDRVLDEARKSAAGTHNHPESIAGAQATAAAIFLARTGRGKDDIRDFVVKSFGYRLDEPLAEVRQWYKFDSTCQGSVPQAILAFLESNDYEDAVRKAVSLGGDSDTQACIAGGIAQAFYDGVPPPIVERVYAILDEPLAAVVREFGERYSCG